MAWGKPISIKMIFRILCIMTSDLPATNAINKNDVHKKGFQTDDTEIAPSASPRARTLWFALLWSFIALSSRFSLCYWHLTCAYLNVTYTRLSGFGGACVCPYLCWPRVFASASTLCPLLCLQAVRRHDTFYPASLLRINRWHLMSCLLVGRHLRHLEAVHRAIPLVRT